MALLQLSVSALLQMRLIKIEMRAFADFLTTEKLLIGVQLMVLGIAIIVTIIYASLAYKKRQHKITAVMIKHLEVWLSRVVLEEYKAQIELPSKFYRALKIKRTRQIVIDELIRYKKNFSGDVSEKLVLLYTQLDLYKDSLKKMRNGRGWHTITKGIQELYQMNQLQYAPRILHKTNSRNEQVRNEAQAGIINLLGFEGLRFLDHLSYPISEWQQIKLLDCLKNHLPNEQVTEKIKKWLHSENESIVIFTLKLILEYKLLLAHDDVIQCLFSKNESIRKQAIKTLGFIANDNTIAFLTDDFFRETYENKLCILDTIPIMSNKEQLQFFRKALTIPDPTLQLRAALSMIHCCQEAYPILQEYARQQPDPFEKIYRHIKTVR